MKILHCCLSSWYVDHYSYQENILPKMHYLQGHQVYIVASTETYIDNKRIGYLKPSTYQTEYGVPIKRLPYVGIINHFITKKLRIYKDLSETLNRFSPNVIFIHGHHFLSIYEIKKYAQKAHGVKIFIDSHCDYLNCARNLLSKNILHKIIYKWCAKTIEPFVSKFYGTLPLRCEFLHKVYGIKKEKIEFLPLGIDDIVINSLSEQEKNEKHFHGKYCSPTSLSKKKHFSIVTGGKIDKQKNIIDLMRVINMVENDDIKLIIFGSVKDDIRNEFDKLADSNKIFYIGWLKPKEIYRQFLKADLAIFPGSHSVLWEQATGCGLPCIFKYTKGIDHVDVGGNCKFLYENTHEELKELILRLYNNSDELKKMRQIAEKKGKDFFAYSNIARISIENGE